MKPIRKSAGILLFKFGNHNAIEVFIVHPGGPFWKNKDMGAWSIPKGEFTDEEEGLDAAIREFKEETGSKISGDFIELTPVKLKSGKMVYAWAVKGDIDAAAVKCETYIDVEWPPRTGKSISIPEVDKGEWFAADEAKQKINPSQAALIDELISKLID
ncbi:MAG TPA: NUDIX domain-containing protein [Chitinophagaceae bacterium]|nr:NUDIX domain-containing protein [Chitinophagaceae bacterium]